jgi:signal transduction histidine kinase
LPLNGRGPLGSDARTQEDLLSEIRDLRTRLEETLGELRAVSKNRNHRARRHSEDEIRWAEERNSERARSEEMLRTEKVERQHAEKELGKTQEQLREVSFRLLLAEETERKRIAQEIHDGISQHWSTVKLRVEEILKNLDQHIATPLEDILPLIRVGLEESRRIQMHLRPALLDDLGILATITWFCREFQKAQPDIRIEAKINIQEDEVPTTVKTVVYRVMQEALNNISRHSNGSLVRITLEKTEGVTEFIIEDNGKGFDLNAVLALKGSERGLGLAGMKERTQLSGGTFLLESAEGVGTTIRASWPVS